MKLKPTSLQIDFRDKRYCIISICIPTYNRPDKLNKCLKSIADQIYSFNLEIIVVDNTETDETIQRNIEVIKRNSHLNIAYFKNSNNVGMFGNWNQCLILASCEYITILNDDDILRPKFIKTILSQIKFKYNMISCEVLYSIAFQDYSRLRTISNYLHNFIKFKKYYVYTIDYLFGNPNIGSIGIVFNKTLAISLGGFDEKLFPASDFDFFMRLSKFGKNIKLSNPLAVYTISENESANLSTIYKSNEIVLLLRGKYIDENYHGIVKFLLSKFNFMQSKFSLQRQISFWSRESNSNLLILLLKKSFIIINQKILRFFLFVSR
jgi:glycosyltransferase involved in cell wall biosynthesis